MPARVRSVATESPLLRLFFLYAVTLITHFPRTPFPVSETRGVTATIDAAASVAALGAFLGAASSYTASGSSRNY